MPALTYTSRRPTGSTTAYSQRREATQLAGRTHVRIERHGKLGHAVAPRAPRACRRHRAATRPAAPRGSPCPAHIGDEETERTGLRLHVIEIITAQRVAPECSSRRSRYGRDGRPHARQQIDAARPAASRRVAIDQRVLRRASPLPLAQDGADPRGEARRAKTASTHSRRHPGVQPEHAIRLVASGRRHDDRRRRSRRSGLAGGAARIRSDPAASRPAAPKIGLRVADQTVARVTVRRGRRAVALLARLSDKPRRAGGVVLDGEPMRSTIRPPIQPRAGAMAPGRLLPEEAGSSAASGR